MFLLRFWRVDEGYHISWGHIRSTDNILTWGYNEDIWDLFQIHGQVMYI
jgi:hypothetical protein